MANHPQVIHQLSPAARQVCGVDLRQAALLDSPLGSSRPNLTSLDDIIVITVQAWSLKLRIHEQQRCAACCGIMLQNGGQDESLALPTLFTSSNYHLLSLPLM